MNPITDQDLDELVILIWQVQFAMVAPEAPSKHLFNRQNHGHYEEIKQRLIELRARRKETV